MELQKWCILICSEIVVRFFDLSIFLYFFYKNYQTSVYLYIKTWYNRYIRCLGGRECVINMIKSSLEKHTVNWLLMKNRTGLLNFNISIQRKEVWDHEHKSNLICSILLGVPVESVLFEEEAQGDGYKVLDGKQRSTTIIKFVNNEFAISDKAKIPFINGVEIMGKTYAELPEDMQEAIREYELSINVMRPLTDDERELVFFMRNQAVALSKIELTRVVMGSSLMDYIEKITNHPFMMKKINITDVSRNKYKDQELALQCLILAMKKDLSFSSKDLKCFAEDLRINGIDSAIKEIVSGTLNYLDTAVPELNKSLKKIHVPMVFAMGIRAIENRITHEDFNDWLKGFFWELKGSTNEYTMACTSGSAQKVNVNKRISFMQNDFDTHFDI